MNQTRYKYLEWKNQCHNDFSKEKIYIKDPKDLKLKLQRLIQDGPQNLQIVSDFDQTISSFSYNGLNSMATFSIFRMSELSPQSFRENMTALYNYYQPFEKDQSIKLEEKNRLMTEWYHKVSDEFKHAQFSLELSEKILNNSNIGIRYLFDKFFEECCKLELPFSIISGGLDMILQSILQSFHSINDYQQLTIKSNQMVYDENGIMDKLEMKVTATSKCQILAESNQKFRDNTLLLGDLPSDYYMTSLLNLKNQVSIGFISEDHIEFLNDHLKVFDITILGDGTFLIPLIILMKCNGEELSEELLQLFAQEQYNELRELF